MTEPDDSAELDAAEPDPDEVEVTFIPIEQAIERADAAFRRARLPVVTGAVLIVGMMIGVLAAEGLPSGVRTVGLIVEMLVVIATFYFLLKMIKVLRYLRSLDAAVRDDEPPPPADEVAFSAPGTAAWYARRSKRANRLSAIALVSFAGMIASGAFIGGDGDEEPNHLAFSIALVMFLLWLVAGFAAGISLLGRRAYRRRLQRHPWREVRCELTEASDRPSLGGPPPLVATVELPDGEQIELVLRMMVMWSALPVRVDGQVHKAWWSSGDDETGCLAGPGGAPVVIAGLVPDYVEKLVEEAIEDQAERKKRVDLEKPEPDA